MSLPSKRLPPLPSIRNTRRPPLLKSHSLSKTTPSFTIPAVRPLARGLRSFHTRRRRRILPPQKIPLHGGLWKFTLFEEKPLSKIAKKGDKRDHLAVAKRWNGRRSLFLGNYKNRRDGAFVSQENTGFDVENLRDPIVDRIFQSKPAEGVGKVARWPCIREVRYTRREFGVGEKFTIDFDLSGVSSPQTLWKDQSG